MAIVGTPTTHYQFEIPENSTSVRKNIFIALDSGEPATGITLTEFTIADGAEFAYFRDDASAAVDAAFDGTSCLGNASTLGTWETATIKEISSSLLPGWYEVGFPDVAFVESANGKAQAQTVFCIKTDATAGAQDVQVTFHLLKSQYPVSQHKFRISENATSVLKDIYIQHNDGTPATGLSKTDYTVAAESQFSYHRADSAAAVDAAFDGTDTIGDTATLGTWITSSFKEISSTLAPGWYEIGLPNAAFVESTQVDHTVSFLVRSDANANVQDVLIECEMVQAPQPHVHRFRIPENATSVLKDIYLSYIDGRPATGLSKTSFTVAAESQFAYHRADAAASVDAAFDGTDTIGDTTTLGTWITSSFKEIDATKMPGWYELGLPDAALVESSQANHTVTFAIKADDAVGLRHVRIEIEMYGGASGGSGGSGATAVQRFIRKANDVNVRENIYLVSDATGEAVTGLASGDFTIANNAEFAYYRGDAAAAVDAAYDATTSLGDTTTLGTWESATIKEISSTLMPGWYEVSFPNAAFIINQTSGVKPRAVTVLIKPEDDASVAPVNVIFDLFRSVAR